MSSFSRRRVLGGAGAVVGANALGMSIGTGAEAGIATSPTGSARHEETKSLDELYADALRAGGELVVYAGGDTPTQQDVTKQAFLARFPNIKLTMVVDYSKYHDVRVDNQLATGTLVPDVVQLQTRAGLRPVEEAGRAAAVQAGRVLGAAPGVQGPGRCLAGDRGVAFSYMYDATLAGGAAPSSPLDLVDPRWKGAIASSYPHDDDAVLYLYPPVRRRPTAGAGCPGSPRRMCSSPAAATRRAPPSPPGRRPSASAGPAR